MNKRLFILLFIILLGTGFNLFSQRRLWSTGTAFTEGKKNIQIAVFGPSVFGINESLDVSTHLSLDILAPNIAIKKAWISKKRISLASRHAASYPVAMYRQIAKQEWISDFDKKTTVPAFMNIKNEVLLSFAFGESTCPAFTSQEFNQKNTFKGPTSILTFKLGVDYALSRDSFPLIEQAFLFPRTAYINRGFSLNAGIDFDARFRENSDFCFDLDYYNIDEGWYALEHKGMIKWFLGKRFFHFLAGYQISFAQTPSGSKFFIAPTFDLLWVMHRNKIDLGLFGKKMF